MVIDLLLACGTIPPLLFMVIFLIEGTTGPYYGIRRNAISALELGVMGATHQLHRLWIELYTKQLAVLMAAKTAAKPLTERGYTRIGQDSLS